MTNDEIVNTTGCPVCRAPRTIRCPSPAPHTARVLLAGAYAEVTSDGMLNVPDRDDQQLEAERERA